MIGELRGPVTAAAARDIRRLPPEWRARLTDALADLSDEPLKNAQKLGTDDAFKVRVGDYRIVFRVDHAAREVLVARVRHRREVYRRG